ncbi:MAG: hypothetical protein HC842_06145 [Cytophagales bacterium]|nr:hypothetical protein [Cytophagales bacterium]
MITLALILVGLFLLAWGGFSTYRRVVGRAAFFERQRTRAGQWLAYLALVGAVLIGLLEVLLGVLVIFFALTR